jgi:glutaminyl-tRNA synthetase
VNNPEDPAAGTRTVPFSREIYIEREDFREDPPKKFFRLSPGAEVRLRYAYIVKCVGLVRDPATGEVIELRCTYDPETLSGRGAESGRRVKGTLHWVSAPHAIEAEVRLYDRLFVSPDPEDLPEGQHFTSNLNPGSLEVLRGCKVEPGLAEAGSGYRCQFERLGYFAADPDGRPSAPVFNRIVGLRDTWAKIEKQL